MTSCVRRSNLVMAATGVLVLLTGCRRGAEGTAHAPVRLSVWTMWSGQEEKNFQRVLDRYHELHPNVIVENLGAVSDDTKTVRAIVAGVPPDLFTLSDSFYLGPLAANDALCPLDDRFRQAGLRPEEFVTAALDQCRYRRRLYAMPYLIDDQALLWNKKAFREAGLDPERPPATLEELEQDALKLTRRDKEGKLVQLGFQPPGDIYLLYRIFGGRLYDPMTNRVTPDDPANVAALQWYADLIRKMGGAQEISAFTAGFGATQGANNPFFRGKIAMMLNGEWIPYWVSRYAPGLEYGVAPIPPPAARPAGRRATWFGGNMFCIPKGSRHSREAWDLLAWMQTDEAQRLFADAMNNVPNRLSTLHDSELRTGADYKRKFSQFLDLADTPNGGCFPPLPVANLYNAQILDAQDLTLLGRKTPAQALADVRVRVQRELDRYR